MAGKVSGAGFNAFLGNFIRISHCMVESIYGHLSILLVTKGEEVRCGELNGVTGSTGRVTGEHLHFSIKAGSIYLDPIQFLILSIDASISLIQKVMERNSHLNALEEKLIKLAAADQIALNLEEAKVYGADFADRDEEAKDG
jgi:hypothetical protein